MEQNNENINPEDETTMVSEDLAYVRLAKFIILKALSFNYITTSEAVNQNFDKLYEDTKELRDFVANAQTIEEISSVFDKYYPLVNRNIFYGDETLSSACGFPVDQPFLDSPDTVVQQAKKIDYLDIHKIHHLSILSSALEHLKTPYLCPEIARLNHEKFFQQYIAVKGQEQEISEEHPENIDKKYSLNRYMSIITDPENNIPECKSWREQGKYPEFKEKVISHLKAMGFSAFYGDVAPEQKTLKQVYCDVYLFNVQNYVKEACRDLGIKQEYFGLNGKLSLSFHTTIGTSAYFSTHLQSISFSKLRAYDIDMDKYGSTEEQLNFKKKVSTAVHEWTHAFDNHLMQEIAKVQKSNGSFHNYNPNELNFSGNYPLASISQVNFENLLPDSNIHKALVAVRDILETAKQSPESLLLVKENLLKNSQDIKNFFLFVLELDNIPLTKKQEKLFTSDLFLNIYTNAMKNYGNLISKDLPKIKHVLTENNLSYSEKTTQNIELLCIFIAENIKKQDINENLFEQNIPIEKLHKAYEVIHKFIAHSKELDNLQEASTFLQKARCLDLKDNSYYYQKSTEIFSRLSESHLSLTNNDNSLIARIMGKHQNKNKYNTDDKYLAPNYQEQKNYVIKFQYALSNVLGMEAMRNDSLIVNHPNAYEKLCSQREKSFKFALFALKTAKLINSVSQTMENKLDNISQKFSKTYEDTITSLRKSNPVPIASEHFIDNQYNRAENAYEVSHNIISNKVMENEKRISFKK